MIRKSHILVLNGPNLNMLGIRECEKYGSSTLKELVDRLSKEANQLNVKMNHFQSNSEYEIIDYIHNSRNTVNYILINPAAFAHTSIAIRDALLSVSIPFIEIHLSNIYTREPFRHHSYLSDIASGIICGLGVDGYSYALQTAIKRLSLSH